MKNNELLEIRFKNVKSFWKEAEQAFKNKKSLIQTKNVIYFESVEVFRNFMTIQKVEILTVIYNHNPKSIYELAKMVGRNFPAVLRDCTSLKSTGFIEILASKNTKGAKKPILAFSYKGISIYLPMCPYQIEFKEAA
jgi:predicted transcriptional regulator